MEHALRGGRRRTGAGRAYADRLFIVAAVAQIEEARHLCVCFVLPPAQEPAQPRRGQSKSHSLERSLARPPSQPVRPASARPPAVGLVVVPGERAARRRLAPQVAARHRPSQLPTPPRQALMKPKEESARGHGRHGPSCLRVRGTEGTSQCGESIGSSPWDALGARVRGRCAAPGPVCGRPGCALCWCYACLRYANLRPPCSCCCACLCCAPSCWACACAAVVSIVRTSLVNVIDIDIAGFVVDMCVLVVLEPMPAARANAVRANAVGLRAGRVVRLQQAQTFVNCNAPVVLSFEFWTCKLLIIVGPIVTPITTLQ